MPALLACWVGVFLIAPRACAHELNTVYRDTVLTIQKHIQEGDLDGARTLLSAALERYPSDGGLENLLGVIDIQQGDVTGARQAFSESIRHSPKLISAYLNLGRLSMEDGSLRPAQLQETIRQYETVLQLDPDNSEAIIRLAALLMWQSKYQASLKTLSKLNSQERQQPGAEAVACLDELSIGNKKAGDIIAASVISNAGLTEQDVMMVLPILRAAHRADLVEAFLSSVAASEPLSPAGLRVPGLAQEAEGKPQKARTTLERAFALDNSDLAPLEDLARIAVATQDYKGALGYLAHARDLQPNDASLAYEFGVVCLKLHLLGETIKAMGDAVKLAPNVPDYNLGIGTVLTFAQESSQALPYLKTYHQLRPTDPAGILELAIAYFESNDLKNASIWLNRAARIPGTAAQARYYLGSILRRQGDMKDAVAQLSSSVALNPDQPDTYAELGEIYMEMGKYSESQTELNRAIALNETSYAANLALLQLYSRTGDARRAEQLKVFEAIRENNQEQYKEAMRVIEVRPRDGLHP